MQCGNFEKCDWKIQNWSLLDKNFISALKDSLWIKISAKASLFGEEALDRKPKGEVSILMWGKLRTRFSGEKVELESRRQRLWQIVEGDFEMNFRCWSEESLPVVKTKSLMKSWQYSTNSSNKIFFKKGFVWRSELLKYFALLGLYCCLVHCSRIPVQMVFLSL